MCLEEGRGYRLNPNPAEPESSLEESQLSERQDPTSGHGQSSRPKTIVCLTSEELTGAYLLAHHSRRFVPLLKSCMKGNRNLSST